MPRWMSKAHFFDLEKEWPTFVAHLRKGCDIPRVPFMAPDLPPHFVQRAREFDALKNLLLTADRAQPVAITTALTGAGGFGKTTLAAALCHDEDIIENFDDGILWVTLGQSPDLMRSLTTAYAALSGERPGFAGEEERILLRLRQQPNHRRRRIRAAGCISSGSRRPLTLSRHFISLNSLKTTTRCHAAASHGGIVRTELCFVRRYQSAGPSELAHTGNTKRNGMPEQAFGHPRK